jgi:hypothetical protein
MSARAEFHPADHAWLAQFGASLPVDRAAVLRCRVVDVARRVGMLVLLALAGLGAGALLGWAAPHTVAWLSAVLVDVVHAAWSAVSAPW